jgi:hypothetical protein
MNTLNVDDIDTNNRKALFVQGTPWCHSGHFIDPP